MWYLWRTGPGEKVGAFVEEFNDLNLALTHVRRAAPGMKIVIRPIDIGVQFIVKTNEATLASLAQAVVYLAQEAETRPDPPEAREIDLVMARKLNVQVRAPGEAR